MPKFFTGHRRLFDICHWVIVLAFLSYFSHSKVINIQSAKWKEVEQWIRNLLSSMKATFLRHICFVYLCSVFGTFAYPHECIVQKWAAPASLPIAWQSSVDLELSIRRRAQMGREICWASSGSSILYDLSCCSKGFASLCSASRLGLPSKFSLKTAATCLNKLRLCSQLGEHHVVKKIVLDAQPRLNLHEFQSCVFGTFLWGRDCCRVRWFCSTRCNNFTS